MAKFVLKTQKDGQFYFNLKAGNGEIIGKSEAYKQKASSLSGIESVRKNSQTKSRFEFKENKAGQTYFNLKATNGQIILTGESYSTPAAAEKGAESIAKNAPEAELVDECSATKAA